MRYYYDLHIHSCLSPCGDPEMTPSAAAGMAMLAGLQVVALSDHNSTGNSRAFTKACEDLGLLSVPAMELSTSEEIHVLCLFPDLDAAERFGAYVHDRLPPVRNNPDYFGEQILMDEEDNLLGEEELLLTNATSIGIYDLARVLKEYGGLAVPAHLDRTSFSLISNLGFADSEMGFGTYEITASCDPAEFVQKHTELSGFSYMVNSDAHCFGAMADARHSLELGDFTPAAVLEAIAKGDSLPVF